MGASTQEMLDRVKARVPRAQHMSHYGLSIAVVAVVMEDLPDKVRVMLGEPAYSPAEIEGVASAILVLEERVNKALRL